MRSDYDEDGVIPYHIDDYMSEEQVKYLLKNTTHCFACQLTKGDCRDFGCREFALVGLALSGGGVYVGGSHGDASKILDFFEQKYISYRGKATS